jgi:tetratricopeptide (TPR) repeat protein
MCCAKMIDTATAKQLLQSKDVAEIQAVVTEYKDHENPDISVQYQILKLLLLLQNRILQLQQESSAPSSEQSATYSGMAKCWMQMGDLEKCQGQLNKALAQDETNVHALLLQGEVQSGQAKYEKAIEYTQKGIDVLLSKPKDDSVIHELAVAYSKLASIYEMMGDFDQAVATLQISVQACTNDAAVPSDERMRHIVQGTVWGHLGTIQEKLGHYAEAVKSLQTAVPAYQAWYGKKHSKTLEMEFLLEMATSTTTKG